jgi:hypothetical protein
MDHCFDTSFTYLRQQPHSLFRQQPLTKPGRALPHHL